MNATYYVYILFSPEFDKYYIGQTNDVQQCLVRHNKGLVISTKAYLPWEVQKSCYITVKKDFEKTEYTEAEKML